jgi:hypothetical protein
LPERYEFTQKAAEPAVLKLVAAPSVRGLVRFFTQTGRPFFGYGLNVEERSISIKNVCFHALIFASDIGFFSREGAQNSSSFTA